MINRLVSDIILYISEYLDSVSFCRFMISCSRFKNLLDNKKYLEKKKLEYVKINPKYSAQYYVNKREYSYINCIIKDYQFEEFINYILNTNNIDILFFKNTIHKIKAIPETLLFDYLCNHKWELLDILYNKYDQSLSLEQIRILINRNDMSVFKWLISNKMLLSNEETIYRSLLNDNVEFIKLLHQHRLIGRNNNKSVLIASKFNSFNCFQFLVENRYFNPETIFEEICKQGNIKYVYYFYQQGYKSEHELYYFVKNENEYFVRWMINNKVDYSSYKKNILLFNIKYITIYYNKSKICKSYLRQYGPENIKQLMTTNIFD